MNPALADEPSCVGMGAIGVLTTGVVFFNALDALGRDGVAHEIQDACQGHPEVSGMYHYHSLTECLPDSDEGHSALMGYVFDGFGFYGVRGEEGEVLTNADLDECHGHIHEIEWEGDAVAMYHYHATYEYPYTIGCYRGTPVMGSAAQAASGGGQNGQGGNTLPQGQGQGGSDLAAAAIVLGISEQALRDALGAPPPDFAAAAATLGITEQALRDALGVPPGR